MSNKKRKCDSGDPEGADLDHPLIVKLDGLVDKIKSRFNTHRGKIPNSLQKTLDDHLNTVIRSCEHFMWNSNDAAGEWFHDATIHEELDVANVKKVIDLSPDALVHENEDGYIPIQTIFVCDIDLRYFTLLAEEASKRDMGPERGGLFLPNPLETSFNILQSLLIESANSHSTNKGIESDSIRAMEALRNAKLFINEDLARFNLLGIASHKYAQERLEYLINLYPTSISAPLPDGDYPIHISNYRIADKEDKNQVFATFLKHGMKYYPEKFGFLFKRNANGERPIKQAIAKFGKKETLDIIQQAIPPSEDHPILHFVYRYTPSLADDFVYRYPNAIRLKDRQGRHLLHIAVKRGLKLKQSLMMMIHCDKKCLKEKDPVTNLYPFMLAATSGYPKDLTTIYNLLSYCPEVMSRCLDDEGAGISMAFE